MAGKKNLQILFACILGTMILCTGFATTRQSILQWGGLTRGPDRYWTIATLFDAYFGFITFYVWVFFKEHRWLSRIAWFTGIMLLGNMAMATYVLLQLARLRNGEPASNILLSRRD